MNVTWGLLTVLGLVCHTESRCSPTSYYKNCWIRRFPGIFIDVEESQRRGAQLLKHYEEESALKCSRTCCLTRNFSCNLAIFHYDASQDSVNCVHLHCPTLESCILRQRGNVVLYNITKGVDPDLLVFGKYLTSNIRVVPHYYSRLNGSEPLPSDKRQFIHPPLPAVLPLTSAPTVKTHTTNTVTTSVSTTTTTTLTVRGISKLPSVSTITTSLSSSSSEPLDTSGNDAQTTPTTSTTSPVISSIMPPSSTAATTFSSHNPQTTPKAAQPSTFPPQHYPTTTTTTTALMGNTESSNVGRNHTSGGEEGQDVSEEDPVGGLGPGWHITAHTLLVVVAVCITVLLSCCCSILLLLSWRGQRKRMGHYPTSWRGRGGSMRLIKYVLVRENT